MGLGTSRSHSGNCDSQYYLKIINYIGEQLRRSDIFVAASAAEEKNAVGVGFCLTIIIRIPLHRSFIHFFSPAATKMTPDG